MAKRANAAAAAGDRARTLTITRAFDAPRDAVFQAWIDPAQLARWLGPRNVKAEVVKMDARPGGPYRIAMHNRGGTTNIVAGTYREVVPPERLVFTWAWEGEMNADPARHETLVTITLHAVGSKTELTLSHERFATRQSRDSHEQGWTGSFDKLAELFTRRPSER